MNFAEPLVPGRLLRRYKRFLADVELEDGTCITAHTANTGAMTGCCAPGSRVWLSVSPNPARRYRHTWELVEVAPGSLVGINTARATELVREAIAAGRVPGLDGYAALRSEVRSGDSRIDLLLTGHDRLPDCFVEVKSVTLAEGGIGYFPDAVSARATRHLERLAALAADGIRAVIFFCVQRGDTREVRPADHVDPVYGAALRSAIRAGVEAVAFGARVTPEALILDRALPVCVDPA